MLSATAIIGTHLSRISQDYQLWTTQEFALFELPNEMLSIVMVFSYATLLLHLYNFSQLKLLYYKIAQHFKLFLTMNVASLLNWLGSILSLKYFDPATAVSLILSIIAISVFFIVTPFSKFKQSKHLIAGLLLIIISMLLIITQHLDTTAAFTFHQLFWGLTWCIVSGIAGSFIGTISEQLGKAHFNVTQILATRFYLLIIVAVIALLVMPHPALHIEWRYYFFSSILIVLLPLLYQATISHLDSSSYP